MTTPTTDTTPAITWQTEIEVAVRDGYQCRRCDAEVVAEEERSFVRIDPTAGDDLANLALVCAACRNGHSVHPEPIPVFGDRTPTLT